jgi:O-antigen ligase
MGDWRFEIDDLGLAIRKPCVTAGVLQDASTGYYTTKRAEVSACADIFFRSIMRADVLAGGDVRNGWIEQWVDTHNVRLAGLVALAACGLMLGGAVALLSPVLVVAALVGLAGFLVLVSSMQAGFVAIILITTLLPFAALPVNVGFYPTFLDIAIGVLLALWFLRLLARPDEQLVGSPVNVPLLVFIALACLSFVLGTAYSMSRDVIRHFGEIILALIVYFAVINNVRQPQQIRLFVKLLIVGGFLASLIGLFLYLLPAATSANLLGYLRAVHYYPEGQGVIRYIADNPEAPRRATSTAVDPNVLGGMLILTSALALSQLFSKAPVLRREVVGVMLAVMGACLLATFSRGSWAGLAAAALFMAVVKYRRMWGLFAILAIAIYLFAPQADVFVGHLLSGARFQDQAAAMRLGEYKDALKLIMQFPLFGVGFGAAPNVDTYLGVSNVYLLIAEEMGLLGLAAFFAVIAAFLAYVMPRLNKIADPTMEGVLLGLTAALVGALAAGVLDHYFFNLQFPHTVTLFWLMMALAVVVVQTNETDKASHT